jgi:hypothetical protein
MARVKTEHSGWPFRIEVLGAPIRGQATHDMANFVSALSPCPKTHVFRRAGADYMLYSFADRAQAEGFHRRFGGTWVT